MPRSIYWASIPKWLFSAFPLPSWPDCNCTWDVLSPRAYIGRVLPGAGFQARCTSWARHWRSWHWKIKRFIFIVHDVGNWNLLGCTYLKSTLQSMYLKSGNCMRSVLCIGVNWRNASAVMLYWSKVHRVLSNQMFFSGHHMAWSDQSMAMSETRKCPYLALLKRKWGPKIRI